jgi:hypothetical protein
MATFPADHYDEKGIYIPRLYGQPWQYWHREHGLCSVAEIKAFVIANGIKLRDDGILEFRDIPK